MSVSSENGLIALDETGHSWRIQGGSWIENALAPLPVPVAEIKLWAVEYFVTYDNTAWSYDPTNGWESIGPWPGGASPVSSTTWGTLKAGYR